MIVKGKFGLKGYLKLVLFFLVANYFLLTLTSPASADNLKVGILLPLTGKLAEIGRIEKKSFLMAADEINKAAIFSGNTIDLLIEDTGGHTNAGKAAVEKLISQDEVIVLGGGCSSSVAWHASRIAQGQKVPFLINTASADKLSEGRREYIFRLNPPVSEHTKELESFLRRKAPFKRAAIVYENNRFGEFGSKKFVRLCKRMGIQIFVKRAYEPESLDYKSLLLKVKAKDPGLFFMVSNTNDAVLMVRQSDALGLKPEIFVGYGEEFTKPAFQRTAGEVAELIYFSTLWFPTLPYKESRNFYKGFLNKFGFRPNYHAAQAYAGIWVIADALMRARSFSRKDVRDALAETSMMTALGPVQFQSYGRKTQQNILPTYVVRWIDGRLRLVSPRRLKNLN